VQEYSAQCTEVCCMRGARLQEVLNEGGALLTTGGGRVVTEGRYQERARERENPWKSWFECSYIPRLATGGEGGWKTCPRGKLPQLRKENY
jgi:hypothetical protein